MPLIATAGFFGIGSSLYILAMQKASVAAVSCVAATSPLFAALLAWVWLGEKTRLVVFLAILVALGGVGVVAFGELRQLHGGRAPAAVHERAGERRLTEHAAGQADRTGVEAGRHRQPAAFALAAYRCEFEVRAQHLAAALVDDACRGADVGVGRGAEVFLQAHGWVAMDPADVLKVMRQETGEWIKDVSHPVAAPVAKGLFGAWEGNWVGWNTGHDITLPGSERKGTLPFLMYPNGENDAGAFDELAPDSFRYTISAREVSI